MALLFVKVANLPELAYSITGANLKLLYLVAPFAYIGAVFSRGLSVALRDRSVLFFLLFYGWMVLATPFSSWVGGSFGRVKDFGIHMVPILIVTASVVLTWKQVRAVFGVMALSGVVVLASTRFFGVEAQGRIQLSSSGTIGNSNDLAAHLLFLTPFLLWVVMDPARNPFFRIGALGSTCYSLYVILGTGSRGALVAIFAGMLFFLVKAQMKVRLGFLIATLLLAIALPMVLPDTTKARLGALFGEEHAEADESQRSRRYLFEKSVEFSLRHPLFGVGPDQFATYEGNSSREQGFRGNWHATHCAWTQVSSECGIPALLFLLLALGTSLVPLHRSYRDARKHSNQEIIRTCFCLLLAIVMLLAAITFLSQAYNFYIALIVGLAIATVRAARLELGHPTVAYRS
jgi:O-antigen ligase